MVKPKPAFINILSRVLLFIKYIFIYGYYADYCSYQLINIIIIIKYYIHIEQYYNNSCVGCV